MADDEALQELHTRALLGWEIEMYVSRGYFKSLYIREPGGNRVEFATLTPGFTLDEPLEHLGKRWLYRLLNQNGLQLKPTSTKTCNQRFENNGRRT